MKKLVVLTLVCCAVAFASELSELQEILTATNATWTAGENEIALQDERGEIFFGDLELDDTMDYAFNYEVLEPMRASSYIAPHTSVKNQGSCGSCYAFAAVGCYESYRKVKDGVTIDGSEQDFMMKAPKVNVGNGCQGGRTAVVLDVFKKLGITTEANCPYLAYEKACANSGTELKINSWATVNDLASIKSALQKYGALLVALVVYKDFMSYKSGVYRYTTGNKLGGHAVLLVGFDDAKQAFKVKNSWGPSWGENGYFWIGYDQMDNCVQFISRSNGAHYIKN
jgi:C1A family cysteine protease